MMVVPVDADINETQDVAEKRRHQRQQFFPTVAVWDLHLQHHDRYDDRDHSVAERLQPSFAHLLPNFRNDRGIVEASIEMALIAERLIVGLATATERHPYALEHRTAIGRP